MQHLALYGLIITVFSWKNRRDSRNSEASLSVKFVTEAGIFKSHLSCF